jgi:Ran GTPase-activating protein (RanGAP) involved in mRNA processing and transport
MAGHGFDVAGFESLSIDEVAPAASDHESNLRGMVHDSWAVVDVNSTGVIDRYELLHLVELLGGNLSAEELDDAMASMGADYHGLVGIEQVCRWCVDQRGSPAPLSEIALPSMDAPAPLPPMSRPPTLHEMEDLVGEVISRELEKLDLSFSYVGTEHCSMLAEKLPSARVLREVDLRSNGLSDDGVNAFTVQLPGSSVVDLDLRFNGVGPMGVSLLAKALATDPDGALARIDLRANRVGVDGSEVLARALRRNRSLRELNLGVNGIGDEGAWELASALEDNDSLEFLGLDGNDITSKGIEFFPSSLRKNRSLRCLSLAMNKIGDEGGILLGNMLRADETALHTLELSGNGLSDAAACVIAEALSTNSGHLQRIDLSGNFLTDEGVQILQGQEESLVEYSRVNTMFQKALARK